MAEGAAAVEEVAEKLDNMSLVNGSEAAKQDEQQNQAETASYAINSGKDEAYWGFPLHETYKMALRFYKENEGKRTFDLSYEDKVYFAALTKQVTHGPYAQQTQLPEIGYLDMFGNDRRRVWESLEDISSNDARRSFIKHLQSVAPVFEPFMVAHQKQREEEERKRIAEEKRRQEEEEQRRIEEEERRRREEESREQERVRQEQERMQLEQKRQLMAVLNEQTAQQFQQYAAQQFPGNAEQQAILIAQLQEQHFKQYMQLYQNQQLQQQNPQSSQNPVSQQQAQEQDSNQSDESDVSEDSQPRIDEPSVWTRPQIQEFKDQIKRDPESVITVGRGEVVTVRVPTHEEGSYVFWEFATDYYDLGFGVNFEWTDSIAQQVSIHVNETTDEEGSGDDEEETARGGGDVEAGSGATAGKNRPNIDEIVPIFRRECHTAVQAGSHRYPGRGVYLLKFDNSYSLWRSKTLYYRVYYTR